ncbi:hypothetical protein DMA12_15485 [Amycolatopsis balhimycina DSM 5908]|uniref:Uncharacterized protein n=1 Tax=Amycolatopsis balhimycina DSM 5908 TaxID=1081091 RepID=A0A428WNC8_AMYBA|nr:hypothetical protein [Amycolatopsis balhimycina]RSM44575.1 hypothetical protein DMA12_15485 [Amycolatopsis balhimycina DSM 5908]
MVGEVVVRGRPRGVARRPREFLGFAGAHHLSVSTVPYALAEADQAQTDLVETGRRRGKVAGSPPQKA